MHFLIRETPSFYLIYVAACYLVGTGMCHNMVGLLQHYYMNHFQGWKIPLVRSPWRVEILADE